MNPSLPCCTPAEAAKRLGVSVKALRLYEQHGLVRPSRTTAGWRLYSATDMARAEEVVTLRALDLSFAEVRRVLGGEARDLDAALAAHQSRLEEQVGALAERIEVLGGFRRALKQGNSPTACELGAVLGPRPVPVVAFDLPWPWGGERFEWTDHRPITYIVGPLGSGKTRLAKCLAEALPGGLFLGLERLDESHDAVEVRLNAEPALKARVDRSLTWLAGEGAEPSHALLALLIALEAEGPSALVVDMVEQGLDRAAQEALIAHLRRRGPGARTLFLLTRSNAILDLDDVGLDEAILHCPANHAPPFPVTPCAGAPGYEAVAMCLAAPDVRARTEGVVAWRRSPHRAG